jgi:hypothetical protein
MIYITGFHLSVTCVSFNSVDSVGAARGIIAGVGYTSRLSSSSAFYPISL